MVLDASLIGGVRVVVGDEVLDTSVKAVWNNERWPSSPDRVPSEVWAYKERRKESCNSIPQKFLN